MYKSIEPSWPCLNLSREQCVEDDCFAAGLLHDAGKLILASAAREKYGEVLALVKIRIGCRTVPSWTSISFAKPTAWSENRFGVAHWKALRQRA
jgi:hypothetical protein